MEEVDRLNGGRSKSRADGAPHGRMNLSVWCVTFNVAMKKTSAEQIELLMAPIKGKNKDIVVIGMQEVAHSELMGGTLLTWQSEVSEWMAIYDGGMTLVAKTFQATNQTTVFVGKKILPRLKNIQFRYSKNTLGGLTGHKGSIGINLQLKNNYSIVFVVSHFVHDVTQYERRIAQYETNKVCAFPEDKRMRSVFWMGDLNFRVEGEPNEVFKEIMKGNLKGVLEAEQLVQACTQQRIFVGYKEAPLIFPPSYRISIGTDKYDLKRTPSWCDRILFKGSDISCNSYSSIREVKCSDHFPVQGHFTLAIPPSFPNIEWDVHFEHIPTWYTSLPVTVRFQMAPNYWDTQGAYLDWIGVYPNSLDDATTPLKWVYLMTCYEQSTPSQRWNVAELSALPPGDYRIAYHSSTNNCLVGIGKSFKVIKTPESDDDTK